MKLHSTRALSVDHVHGAPFKDRQAFAVVFVQADGARLGGIDFDPVVLVDHQEVARLDRMPRDREGVFFFVEVSHKSIEAGVVYVNKSRQRRRRRRRRRRVVAVPFHKVDVTTAEHLGFINRHNIEIR
jgi:hypothetical protein